MSHKLQNHNCIICLEHENDYYLFYAKQVDIFFSTNYFTEKYFSNEILIFFVWRSHIVFLPKKLIHMRKSSLYCNIKISPGSHINKLRTENNTDTIL